MNGYLPMKLVIILDIASCDRQACLQTCCKKYLRSMLYFGLFLPLARDDPCYMFILLNIEELRCTYKSMCNYSNCIK